MMTDRKELFAREYIIDYNATKAAIRAGYSEKTAYSQGHRLLKDAEINRLIKQFKQERIERLEFTADDVLRELGAVAFSDITDVVTVIDDKLLIQNTEDLPPLVAKSIESIKETTGEYGGSITVKLHSKLTALQTLGKHFGIIKDSVEHSGKVTLEEMIGGSYEKEVEGN